MTDLTQLEQEYKQVQADLKSVGDTLKSYAEKSEKEIKAHQQLSEESKAKADTALAKFNELQAKLNDITQKLERPQDNPKESVQSLGKMVVESESFKNANMNASFRGSVRVNAPRSAITTTTTNIVAPDRQAGIIAPPVRRMTIRDLLIPGTTNSNSIEFVRETGFTNNATTVGESMAKPYSDITFGLVNSPVRTVAHLFKASRQILDDVSGLISYIDGRARNGLQLAEEKQLLFGNGSGSNILGIVPQASSFTPSLSVANATAIDRIRLALLQAVLAEFPSNGIVLNPIDWAGIELTKDNEGRYIIGNPMDGTTPRLWNLPVVETQAMNANNFLVGAFNMAAQIFDRMDMEVLISTENDKDFENNMITIRAEERLALAVYRPEAFVTGEVTPTV
ncbi:phage major capsid protein [Gilliamella sp. Bif1-4]|uniref:phage major capsid protein n=1 Tax=Gilliamella sp. Bif1-4 TaxID=3120233 RepID=UPI00080E3A3D|nr:phage major capsid protein [Gilliamella apicola]OCG39730.1 capsid protein [Gilliamella apicola]